MAAGERVAVVTGAASGIGREVARQLARNRIRVVLTARNTAKGEAARDTLAAEALHVAYHMLDVREPDQASALAQRLEREYGRVDILVNNAGVLLDPKGTQVATMNIDVARETLETNLIGPLVVTQALLPLMKRNTYGRIVNMSSGLGQLAEMDAGAPAYRISKTALNAFTRTLAAELKDAGIKVNALCPGWVRTDIGGANAPRSVEEGADTAVWLAMLPDDGPTGGFFRDRKAIAW